MRDHISCREYFVSKEARCEVSIIFSIGMERRFEVDRQCFCASCRDVVRGTTQTHHNRKNIINSKMTQYKQYLPLFRLDNEQFFRENMTYLPKHCSKFPYEFKQTILKLKQTFK